MSEPRATWKLKDGRVLSLMTVRELRAQPNGTVLYDIFGERVVVGETEEPLDEYYTRGGFTAFGVQEKGPDDDR